MLKWFNKQSTSSFSSQKSEENQQYPQLINSALTEGDYEFLFNQLLDGVAHGWHLGKIIKFFSNLEPRSNITQWIDWVEKFEKKINYSPDPSQKKVGAIMMRFGELTKPNDDLEKLGTLFYRIGNQLFVGGATELVWEYAGQDLVGQKTQLDGAHAVENYQQTAELANESDLEFSNHHNSAIIDPDSHAELELEAEKSLANEFLQPDLVGQNNLESQEADVSEQPHRDSLSLETNLEDQNLQEDVAVHDGIAQLIIDEPSEQPLSIDTSLGKETLVTDEVEENEVVSVDLESNEESLSGEFSLEENSPNQAVEHQYGDESPQQASIEEFSAEEELINQAFEEELAAHNQVDQHVDELPEPSLATDNSPNAELISEEDLINHTFEENLGVQAEVETSQESLTSKFSPEEELINQAFEEELAAQSKRSESSSSPITATDQSQDQVLINAKINAKNRDVVLDLSLDLPSEEVGVDAKYSDLDNLDNRIEVDGFDQEQREFSDLNSENVARIADEDLDLSHHENAELQKLAVTSNDLEVTSGKFSVGSFLEATEALSADSGISSKKVTVTWDEFVFALEQDPVLARNVAQQLGMVGANNPQTIVQAAVDRFRTQKQAQLSPANLELVKSWFQLGLKQASAKDFQGAISSWDQALNLNPNLSEAWHNKGSALGRLGKYIEAIQSFDHAVHLDPESYQAWNDRAHALYKMQEWSKAIASWDRAIQITPDRHQFWYNRGCALEQIKSFDESITSYEKALEIKPDFQPARARHTVLIANSF